MAAAVGHMTPTNGNHVTAVKQTILLPNVGVGKIITRDKDVRLVDDDVDEEVY